MGTSVNKSTAEQSSPELGSRLTADTRWHDRQCQKQRTNLTTPMQRHLQSLQPAGDQTEPEQQFLSNGPAESQTGETAEDRKTVDRC